MPKITLDLREKYLVGTAGAEAKRSSLLTQPGASLPLAPEIQTPDGATGLNLYRPSGASNLFTFTRGSRASHFTTWLSPSVPLGHNLKCRAQKCSDCLKIYLCDCPAKTPLCEHQSFFYKIALSLRS